MYILNILENPEWWMLCVWELFFTSTCTISTQGKVQQIATYSNWFLGGFPSFADDIVCRSIRYNWAPHGSIDTVYAKKAQQICLLSKLLYES